MGLGGGANKFALAVTNVPVFCHFSEHTPSQNRTRALRRTGEGHTNHSAHPRGLGGCLPPEPHNNPTITSRASCSSAFPAPKRRCAGVAAPLPPHTSQTQHVPKVFGDPCQIVAIKAAASCSAERSRCHSPPPLGTCKAPKNLFAQLKQNQQRKRRVSRSRCSWEMRQKAG